MTLSDMAVADGSTKVGAPQPVGVNARARVNRSVAVRDRIRVLRASRIAGFPRRAARVVYCDAADSWLYRESTPSVQAILRNAYLDTVPESYQPLLLWCGAYRYFAAAVALVLNAALWLLIHPARGPLTLLTALTLGVYATH